MSIKLKPYVEFRTRKGPDVCDGIMETWEQLWEYKWSAAREKLAQVLAKKNKK